jgi:hypothetical protein
MYRCQTFGLVCEPEVGEKPGDEGTGVRAMILLCCQCMQLWDTIQLWREAHLPNMDPVGSRH